MSDDDETLSGDFSKSIMLPRDRVMERDLEAILAAISTENWTSIAQVLYRLTAMLSAGGTVSQGGLVELDGVVCSTDVAIARVFDRLPSAGRSVVLRLVEPIVQEQLATALKTQDTAALQQIARRYRFTPTGQKARLLYQQVRRDQGDDALPVTTAGPFTADSVGAGWRQSLTSPEQTQRVFADVARYLRQSGSTPYPKAHLVAGQTSLLASMAGARQAIHAQTGEVLWTRLVPGYGPNWYRDPGDVGDSNRGRLFSMVVGRRVFGDAVYARAASDASHYFFLESVMDETVPATGEEEPEFDEKEFFTPFPANRLICVDQKTGETVWMQPQALEKSIFYAGTPLVTNGVVWILGESRATQSLTLYQYDAARGDLIESIDVAQAKLSISQDLRRQEIDCQVVWQGDQLFCPTAAGGLFAVDRWTGDVLWAHRFARNDVPEYQRDLELIGQDSGFDYWSGWQRTQIFSIDGLLVSVSPERDELLVVEQQHGRRLWSLTSTDGLHVACANAEQGVVMIGRTSAEAYDLKTGMSRWRAAIPRPAGEGVTAGGFYSFPILDQGIAQLDLQRGTVQVSRQSRRASEPLSGPLPDSIRFRNLVFVGPSAYEIHADGVQRFAGSIPEVLSGGLDPAVESVRQKLTSGEQTAGLAQSLRILESTAAGQNAAQRQALLHLLEEHLLSLPEESLRTQWGKAVESGLNSPAEKGAWRKQRALAAVRHQELAAFAEIWITTSDDELAVTLTDSDPNLQSRLDRWFQQTAVEARVHSAETLDEAMNLHLAHWRQQENRDSSTRFSMMRRLGETPWGHRFRLQDLPEVTTLPELLSLQLHLKIQSQVEDHSLAAGAAWRLFDLYRQRGELLDAARWLNTLAKFDPDLPLPDGRILRDVCSAEIGPLQSRIDQDPSLASWPQMVPERQVRARGSREVYLVPMEVPEFMESGFERLTVHLDYPARQAIRFSGSAHSRPWYGRLTQEFGSAPLDEHLDRCWGMEQLLVVQCGTSLYGLAPFDLSGKPRSRVLWPADGERIDTLGDRSQFLQSPRQQPDQERPGFPFAGGALLDEFLHPLASVGPVRSGYVCRQQLGMLVATDPVTGVELWRRYDLPPRAECYGNEERIAVVSPDEPWISVYSAIDGRRISVEPRQFDPDHVIGSSGVELFLVQGDEQASSAQLAVSETASEGDSEAISPPPVRGGIEFSELFLTRFNLVTGEVVWQRRWGGKGLPFNVDDRLMGVLITPADKKHFDPVTGSTIRQRMEETSQEVELIDLKTGQTVSTQTIPPATVIDRIYCSVFDRDVLVIFSEAIADEEERRQEQIRGGFRRPWVKGPVFCFDRETGVRRWSINLPESEFPLDQPPELPVFVTAEVRSAKEPFVWKDPDSDVIPSDESKSETVLTSEPEVLPPGVFIRCYHRETGELLHEIQEPPETLPSFTVQGNRQQRTIQVQTVRTRLDLQFGPAGSGSPADQ